MAKKNKRAKSVASQPQTDNENLPKDVADVPAPASSTPAEAVPSVEEKVKAPAPTVEDAPEEQPEVKPIDTGAAAVPVPAQIPTPPTSPENVKEAKIPIIEEILPPPAPVVETQTPQIPEPPVEKSTTNSEPFIAESVEKPTNSAEPAVAQPIEQPISVSKPVVLQSLEKPVEQSQAASDPIAATAVEKPTEQTVALRERITPQLSSKTVGTVPEPSYDVPVVQPSSIEEPRENIKPLYEIRQPYIEALPEPSMPSIAPEHSIHPLPPQSSIPVATMQQPTGGPPEPSAPLQRQRTDSPAGSDSKRRSVLNAGTAWQALGSTSRAVDETSSTKSQALSVGSSTTEGEPLDAREFTRNSRLQESVVMPAPPPAPSVPPSPLTRYLGPYQDSGPTPRHPEPSQRYSSYNHPHHNPPSYYNNPSRHYSHPSGPYNPPHNYSPMDSAYRSDSTGSFGSHHGEYSSRNHPPPPNQLYIESGDEATKIIGQLSSTIPEIQKLMARYHETQGKLGEREERIREAEAKQEEILRHQDARLREQYEFINNLRSDLDNARSMHTADSNKHRIEIGTFQDQQRELMTRISQAEAKGRDMENAKAQSEAKIQELENEKAKLDKAMPEERERMMREFDEWKAKAKEEADASHAALAMAFVEKESAYQADLDKKLEEAKVEHESKTKKIEEDFAHSKREFEAQVTVLRAELDDTIKREASISTELDELKKSTAESHTKMTGDWASQQEALKKEWEDGHAKAKQEWEEQHAKAKKEWEDDQVKSRKAWEAKHAKAKEAWEFEREQYLYQQRQDKETHEKKLEEEVATRNRDVASLQEGWNEDKIRLEALTAELRGVLSNMDSEKSRLQKLISASALTTDLKSKGDTF